MLGVADLRLRVLVPEPPKYPKQWPLSNRKGRWAIILGSLEVQVAVGSEANGCRTAVSTACNRSRAS